MEKERTEKARAPRSSRVSARVEELAYSEKIAKALDSCEAYLEKSIAATESACEESDNWIWHAAAELEYAQFLFSLKGLDEDFSLNWKTGSRDGNASGAELLNTGKKLVIRAKESTAAGDWLQARQCAYAAGSILLRIQREQARKKRGSVSK